MRRRKIRKHDSEHTCRALPQSLLNAPRGHDGVLHRPDQTRTTPVNNLYFSGVVDTVKKKSLKFIVGVNDIAEKLFSGVNNTTDKFFGGVSDTSD